MSYVERTTSDVEKIMSDYFPLRQRFETQTVTAIFFIWVFF